MDASAARRRPRSVEFVRYCSPYGTPEWLDRHTAERRQAADLKVFHREALAGTLTARQRDHGPPRIEEA